MLLARPVLFPSFLGISLSCTPDHDKPSVPFAPTTKPRHISALLTADINKPFPGTFAFGEPVSANSSIRPGLPRATIFIAASTKSICPASRKSSEKLSARQERGCRDEIPVEHKVQRDAYRSSIPPARPLSLKATATTCQDHPKPSKQGPGPIGLISDHHKLNKIRKMQLTYIIAALASSAITTVLAGPIPQPKTDVCLNNS